MPEPSAPSSAASDWPSPTTIRPAMVGMVAAARIAMMAMTTRISATVKPRLPMKGLCTAGNGDRVDHIVVSRAADGCLPAKSAYERAVTCIDQVVEIVAIVVRDGVHRDRDSVTACSR